MTVKVYDKCTVMIVLHKGELKNPFPDSMITHGISSAIQPRPIKALKDAIALSLDTILDSGVPLEVISTYNKDTHVTNISFKTSKKD